MNRSEISHDPHHLGVSKGASKMISKPMVYSTQTVHLYSVKISTIYERIETSFHLSLVTSWYHRVRPKWFSEPMVRLAQTMHLSSTDTNTICKRKQARFHMTHVTKEFHRLHPKRFRSLWYVRCKPCTYLASRLARSLKRPKRAST
jgi:hypothetical protein